MNFVIAILPIALTIACGYAIARVGLLPRDNWGGVETLSFRVLIPAILLKSIIGADISSGTIGPLIWALLATIVISGTGVLLLRPVLRLPDPQLTTVFQTTIRWNAFVSLAAAELFIGPQGVAPIAIAVAVMVPTIQVVSILVLTIYGTAQTGPRRILKIILFNPIVQACSLGIFLNVIDVPLPEPLSEALRLIGDAALGIGLLVIGAGTRLKRLIKVSLGMILGTGLRMIACPLIFLGLAHIFGLGSTETMIGIICLAVPAATNGYIISKQMGGDADLYADILTWQTLASLVALPVYAYLIA